MARKKIETITSLGDDDKLTVQKSLPLFSLWRSELTLPEFKILDTYLSRIDSHKPERRAVRFEKGELERVLGVKKLNNADLKSRLMHLMGNCVQIPDASVKKGFRLVTLFEEAVAEQDENGLWQVSLECTQKAMKYFFNVENLGYLRYKLRCITSITSRYTYITFIYLEANRYRVSWEVPVEELKKILNCDGEETYKTFKRFNDLILKKVQKELTEKTECQYKYESIKKGRSVVAVRFTVFPIRPKVEIEERVAPVREELQDRLEYFAGAVDGELKPEELKAIVGLVQAQMTGASEQEQYSYLQRKWALLKAQDAVKPIKKRYLYLKKMLTPDKAGAATSFTNIEKSETDYEAIARRKMAARLKGE